MEATIDLQKKSPEELLKIVEQLQAQVNSKDQEIELLRHKLNTALHHRFGTKSEKNSNQLSLFDEVQASENKEEIEQADEEITIQSHKRKKVGRKKLSKDLPRIRCIHDLPEDEKICSCGERMEQIGEEISEQLDIIPAKTQVIQHVKCKYACKPCEGNIKAAKAPKQPIPKSIASPGLLAHVAVSKYCDHLPLYRQESIFQRMGVDIARNTLSNWMIKVSDLLLPLYKLLQDNIVNYDIAYADETRVQVLKESGRPPEAKSYMWCFIGGPPDKRSVIYHYNQSRAHCVIKEILFGFEGALHCDGFSGYDTFARVTANVKLIACWMHARRKFHEVVKSSRKEGLAHKAIKMIAKLYKIEKDMKAKKLTADEVYRKRQKCSKPILENFKKWLDQHIDRIPPNSPIGDAFGYAINQWGKLTQFINDGRLEIDNGLSERQIKPFVIGRKNWMFSNSVAGVKASEIIFSIIESAKINGIEPYSYLRYILQQIPSIDTVDEMDMLLPYNIKLEKICVYNI